MRKENAIVKSGVLWRSFDFAEAQRASLLGSQGDESVRHARNSNKIARQHLLDNGYRQQ